MNTYTVALSFFDDCMYVTCVNAKDRDDAVAKAEAEARQNDRDTDNVTDNWVIAGDHNDVGSEDSSNV